jgi:hypothetical protein
MRSLTMVRISTEKQMQLTEREQNLLLRALDKASAPTEAEKAAEALINSLRERGINGYDFLNGFKPKSASPPPRPTSQPPPPPKQASSKGPGAESNRERSKQEKYAWEGWSWESYEKSEQAVLSRESKIDLFSVIATPVAVGSLFIALVCPLIGVPLLAFLIPIWCVARKTETP